MLLVKIRVIKTLIFLFNCQPLKTLVDKWLTFTTFFLFQIAITLDFSMLEQLLFPHDIYKEIISNYRKIVNNLDMYKIEEYLSLFKNDVNLANILQMEVF